MATSTGPSAHGVSLPARGSSSCDQAPKDRATRKRLRRIGESVDIGMALLGSGHDGAIDPIIHLDSRGPCLVDRATGEVLEAEPGQGLALRCAVHHLIHADPDNHWIGAIHAKRGTAYVDRQGQPTTIGLSGSLHTHSSRLCTDHMATLRLKSRRAARAAIALAESRISQAERLAQAEGWNWRPFWAFLTLTLPRIEGATSLREIQRINRAWALFRKRDAFRLHARGGIKAIEDKLTVKGPHVHIHALALILRWDWMDIRREWAECVAIATAELYGIHLDLADLVQGGAVADIRTVRPKVQDPDREITLEDAVDECLKYVTKPADLTQLSADTLLELELVERWGRMFEIFGCCREDHDGKLAKLQRDQVKARRALSSLRARHRDARGALEASLADLQRQIVDVKVDIARLESYRTDPSMDQKARRSAVTSLRQDRVRLRKEAQGLKDRLKALYADQAQEVAPLRVALARSEAALRAYRQARDTSAAEGGAVVHTASISDGGIPKTEGSNHRPNAPRRAGKRPKSPTWRQLMHQLPLTQWLRVILARIHNARRHVAHMLKEVFEGELTTLEGRPLTEGPC